MEKEINVFGARLTIFENGDVFVSTKGDVTVMKARHVSVGGVVEKG